MGDDFDRSRPIGAREPEAHETERHLLTVAVTRARDELWVSGVEPGSDYLADL